MAGDSESGDLLSGEAVEQEAKHGTLHMQFDVKPDYRDTPRNWEFLLEAAFYRGRP